MKIILAITAASGAIYAAQILELLITDPKVQKVALIFSRSAREVADYEAIKIPNSDKVTEYNVDDLFSPPASGSAKWSAMIVAPCSVGTMSRIAAGISDSLISRAADVMLKERRKLILVVREAPLSLIHLRNMTSLTEAGAIIMPASPSFYGGASTIFELALTVSRRAVAMAGCADEVDEWQGR
ncbi:MAG: UbiX family flavin prenyltransferase [Rikenellaceae bacterium]